MSSHTYHSNSEQKKKQNEQYLIRKQKYADLKHQAINPYPSKPEEKIFDKIFSISRYKEKNIYPTYKEAQTYKESQNYVCGRIMSRRQMGKTCFFHIQDINNDQIQVYIRSDKPDTPEHKQFYSEVFLKLYDIGDIVAVSGPLFQTKQNEITIDCREIQLLTKTLRPLPTPKEVQQEDGSIVVYDEYLDKEQCYRQRYLDLIFNPKTKEIFQLRSKIINKMRKKFNDEKYLEVETPILQPIYGGANATPFKTHHKALNMPLYLRIANELYLKRLMIGGFNGVYEFARDFRNEGLSRFHNPEFTQVELYIAYMDYEGMMDYVQKVIQSILHEFSYSTTIPNKIKASGLIPKDQLKTLNEKQIDSIFKGKGTYGTFRRFERKEFFPLMEEKTGFDLQNLSLKELQDKAQKLGVAYQESDGVGKILDGIFGKHVEPTLIDPIFVYKYPIEMSPLAKKCSDNEKLVERFELIWNGKELANGFSELNDPIDQRERFEQQRTLATKGDEEAMAIDEDFLFALEHGMPPTAGVGIGIDRLCMILTGSSSIRDVILFPLMKPQ